MQGDNDDNAITTILVDVSIGNLAIPVICILVQCVVEFSYHICEQKYHVPERQIVVEHIYHVFLSLEKIIHKLSTHCNKDLNCDNSFVDKSCEFDNFVSNQLYGVTIVSYFCRFCQLKEIIKPFHSIKYIKVKLLAYKLKSEFSCLIHDRFSFQNSNDNLSKYLLEHSKHSLTFSDLCNALGKDMFEASERVMDIYPLMARYALHLSLLFRNFFVNYKKL